MATKESSCGVNSYARFWLSWRPEMMRQTRCVARSFCPEFGHHAEFPCRLRAEEEMDGRSLAEVIDNDGKLHVQIFHQVATCPTVLPLDSSHVSATHGDILLGSAQLPLSSMLARDTPIRVILPLRPPQSRDWHEDGRDEEEACGGVEVMVGFTGGASDRRRVVEAGREEGFVPKALALREEEEDGDAMWTATDEFGHPYKRLTVSVDWTDLPVSLALLAVMTELPPSTHLYVRYKVYNKSAVRSRPLPISEALTGSRIRLQFGHTQHMTFRITPCLLSYLREESLEFQIWIRYSGNDEREQNDQRSTDRLLGFAKLDLSSLCAPNRREHRILRTLPLFKRGASSMDGAKVAVRVAISGTVEPLEGEEISDGEGVTVFRVKKKPTSPNRSLGPSFAARVLIDRGSRLNLPSHSMTGLYVTFMSVESVEPQRTNLACGSSAPKWQFSRETQLAERHLTLETPLLFRLWQRTEREDLELGHASVDLSNLRRGFDRIQGWYNVNDVQGECIGQLSITVMPLTAFSTHRETCPSPVPPPVEPSIEPASRSFLLTNLKEKMSSLDTILRNADSKDQPPTDIKEKMSSLDALLRNASINEYSDLHTTDIRPVDSSVAVVEDEEEDMVYVRALNDVSGLLSGLRERIQGFNQQREAIVEESATEAVIDSRVITENVIGEAILNREGGNQAPNEEDLEVEQQEPEPLDVGIIGMCGRSRSSSSSSSSSSSVSSESSDSSSSTSSSSSDDNLEPPAICLTINEGAEETTDLIEIPEEEQSETVEELQARQIEERRIRMRQEAERRREEARLEEERRREEARLEEERRRVAEERRREEQRIEEERRMEEAKRKVDEKRERKRLREEERRRQNEARENEIRAAVEEEMKQKQMLEEEERRRQKEADEDRMAEEEKRKEREKLLELTRGRLPNLCPPTVQNTAERMKYLRLGCQTPPPEEPLSREQMRIQAARELLNRMKREREDGSHSQHQYGQKEMDRMEKIFHMKF